MTFFEDFKLINKVSLERTLRGLKRNWTIGLVGFIYLVLSLLAIWFTGFFLRGPFSILRGIFTTLFISALISNYLVILQLTVLNRKLDWDSFKQGFGYYVWKIYGVFFIMYMVSYLLEILTRGLNGNVFLLNSLVSISFFVLFNALPETIYLKNYIPMDSLRHSLEFMKENWVQWALPNLVLGLVIYLLSKGLNPIYLGGLNGDSIFKFMARAFINQMFMAVFMLYRGNLFFILDNSNRRNRKYKLGKEEIIN